MCHVIARIARIMTDLKFHSLKSHIYQLVLTFNIWPSNRTPILRGRISRARENVCLINSAITVGPSRALRSNIENSLNYNVILCTVGQYRRMLHPHLTFVEIPDTQALVGTCSSGPPGMKSAVEPSLASRQLAAPSSAREPVAWAFSFGNCWPGEGRA